MNFLKIILQFVISEKTFYQSELNPFYKVYLCQLLSEKFLIEKQKIFGKIY